MIRRSAPVRLVPDACTMLIVLVVLCAAGGACAQPAPVLGPLPAALAVERGRSAELVLTGNHLSAINSIALYDARGLQVELAKPAGKQDGKQIHLKISAAGDAVPGEREMRLIGPTGVCKPVRIYVSQYPVVTTGESAGESAGEARRRINLPATLVGRIMAGGNADRYEFDASRGERLIFAVQAARIGSPLEPVVVIGGPDGREARLKIEHHGGDPVLIFDPPADGRYALELRDLQYRGGDRFAYRINAGHIPYLEGVMPSSGRPGASIDIKPIGYNLEEAGPIKVDLTSAAPGRIEVRAATPDGTSNAVPFEVTELPQAIESEPNHNARQASAIAVPTEISAHLDKAGDEDFFRFRLPYRQAISLEVLAGRYGSPVTPLLQLRNAKGDVIESNDGVPDADARIVRQLEAGEYITSVRDLTYAGGPGYWYRLKVEPALRVPQDFAARYLPAALRLHRGGNVAVWCEVRRLNGFHGDVTIVPEGLPAGVTATPVKMDENASGWFTLAAASDAALGTTPIQLRANAMIGTVPVTHYAEPESDGRVVGAGYLTVLDAAPFKVEALAALAPAQLEQMSREIRALSTSLDAPNPKFDAALAAWEAKLSKRPAWTVLNPFALTSSRGTTLARQPDGSVLATGVAAAQDQYTIDAHTDVTGITAIRLEALADPRLPAHGPGTAPNGNFVLSEFKLLMRHGERAAQRVALHHASADFSQAQFPVAAAIDNNPATGWAIDPQQGRNHVAVFRTQSPIASGDDATLTFILDHQSIFAQHNIGRFRISVTNADASALETEKQVPSNILAIVATPRSLRTSNENAELAEYFRTIDPETAAQRSRLAALQSFAAPYAQMQRLSAMLRDRQNPAALEAEQARWEKAMNDGAGWSVLDMGGATSSGGARLERQADGSIFVAGAAPPSDSYELTATTPLKTITALRLELIPDSRLPANGPGRAADGTFILSHIRVTASPRAAVHTPGPATMPAGQAIEFASASASAEAQGFAIAEVIRDSAKQGWSTDAGRPAEATFYPARAIVDQHGGAVLKIRLDQLSGQPQHTIGRFRIWVTGNPQPDAAARPPENVAAILTAPADRRTPEQKRALAVYFRSIAPSLQPVRQQLADLQAMVPAMPPKVQRNRAGAIPVPIQRSGGFNGEVKVTLEGFVKGRDGDNAPPIARQLTVKPLTIGPGQQFGTLTFDADRVGEAAGTRLVVLKAESKVGDETVVDYSPAFPLTIEK